MICKYNLTIRLKQMCILASNASHLLCHCFRLSFSKNGVVRIDGFSSPDQYDDEAMSLWTHDNYDDDELDIETSKYILDIIGDKFCQLVTSEKTALSWVKKDGKEVTYLEFLTIKALCCLGSALSRETLTAPNLVDIFNSDLLCGKIC